MSEYPNLNVKIPILCSWFVAYHLLLVQRSGRASAFRHEPRAVLRLRLSAINPISVRGLSHYRRGVPRCHFHSPRNPSFLPRRASRLRTRLQWSSLLAWEESMAIRSGGRCRGSDGIPIWSMGYCLFSASFFSLYWRQVSPLTWTISGCRPSPQNNVTQQRSVCVMPMM